MGIAVPVTDHVHGKKPRRGEYEIGSESKPSFSRDLY